MEPGLPYASEARAKAQIPTGDHRPECHSGTGEALQRHLHDRPRHQYRGAGLDLAALRRHGWTLTDADRAAGTPSRYAAFIGRSWAELETALPGTAEGAYTVRAALALADRHGVEMPIALEVERALFEGKSVKRCLADLLAREPKDELADFGGWMQRLAAASDGGAVQDFAGTPRGAGSGPRSET